MICFCSCIQLSTGKIKSEFMTTPSVSQTFSTEPLASDSGELANGNQRHREIELSVWRAMAGRCLDATGSDRSVYFRLLGVAHMAHYEMHSEETRCVLQLAGWDSL